MSTTKWERLAAGMAAEIARLDRTGQGSEPTRVEQYQQLANHLWDGRLSRAQNEAVVEKWIAAHR